MQKYPKKYQGVPTTDSFKLNEYGVKIKRVRRNNEKKIFHSGFFSVPRNSISKTIIYLNPNITNSTAALVILCEGLKEKQPVLVYSKEVERIGVKGRKQLNKTLLVARFILCGNRVIADY